MSKKHVIEIKDKKLRISENIDFTQDKEGNKIKLKIHIPYANMQEDYSNFESIIIWIWSVDRDTKVELDYDEYTGEKDHEENHNKSWDKSSLVQYSYTSESGERKYAEPARLHYMRFLYRVMKFNERYGSNGFSLNNEKYKNEIEKFKKLYDLALEKKEIKITEPNSESDIKDLEKNILENHIEKWFVAESINKNLQGEIKEVMDNNRLYDQLPCSIFVNEKKSTNRIFNSGYFDLWGVNNKNELCVFELKRKGNVKLGIISELFFYAMVMKDMKKAGYSEEGAENNYRGFKKFTEANSKVVNAYFLVPEMHSSLKEVDFIKILNEPKDGYKFDIIEFIQNDDEIIKFVDMTKK